MNTFRQNAEAVVVDGQVYVAGGRDFYGKRYLDTIERYDPSKDEWTIAAKLPIYKTGFKCVVIQISRDFLEPFPSNITSSS